MTVDETIEEIEQWTGEKIALDMRIDELNIDSLEYIQMLLNLNLPIDAHYETVKDLIRMAS